MDPDLLKDALEDCKRRGKMPKAVVPTDLYGQCADYERILKICEEYGVPVVADAAEALGTKYKLATDPHRPTQTSIDFSPAKSAGEKVSSHTRADNLTRYMHAGVGAKAAVFSFNGNKIITTSGGGMLASDDKEFIEQARFLSQQARDPFPHYEYTEIGYNYRMSNILAAIGRGQLKVLDKRVKRKREIFDYYKEALGDLQGIEFMPEASYGRSNRWLTVILITPEEFGVDRETVRLALDAENIESRPVWKPMHMQPVFGVEAQSSKLKAESRHKKTYSARVVGGQVAEDLFERGLCLPSGTAMTEEDLNRVIEVILNCKKSY
jgi:dTDP-4-amino-4,6-dideoxygalactose transaminase